MEPKGHHSAHEVHDDRDVTIEALIDEHRPSTMVVGKALHQVLS